VTRMANFDNSFWNNFLSNALATIVGVLIGIPIALWINRIQQKYADYAEKQKSNIESSSRRRKILQLLRGELNENQILLNKTCDDIKNESFFTGFRFDSYRLRVELWSAFSDGGELEWIHDLDLLHSLALAYDTTRMVMFSGERYTSYFEMSLTGRETYGPAGAKEYHSHLLRESIEQDLVLAKNNVTNALQVIDEYLKS